MALVSARTLSWLAWVGLGWGVRLVGVVGLEGKETKLCPARHEAPCWVAEFKPAKLTQGRDLWALSRLILRWL